jgi:arylsulfate sulfotransferase
MGSVIERAFAVLGAVIGAAALCAGCSSSSGGTQDEAGIPMKLVPAYSDDVTEYALEQASTSLPLLVNLDSLGVPARFVDARIGSERRVELSRLDGATPLQLTLTDKDGRQRTIQVSVLPKDFPAYTTQVSGTPAPGRIYTGVFTGFTPVDYSYALILNGDGSPAYFRRFDHPVFNFHKIAYADGRVRYGYLDSPVGFDLNKGAAEGDVVLLDEQFRELRRFRLGATPRHGPLPAENHDMIVFDDDHWVLSAYDTRTVDLTAFGGKADSKVVATVLQEIKAGQVVWEWDSTDYPALYSASVDGNDFANATRPLADYLHFNAIEFDPADGGFLVSLRHMDSILKILPRSVPLGTPIPTKWILGGKLDQFGLGAAQRFYHQHDVRIVSRQGAVVTISLFNNNNGHYDEHPTSAMQIDLDETAKTARVADEYWDAMQSTSQGSAQVLGPRHYFVGWGSDNRITEADRGVKLFTLDFADNLLLYRAQKAP